MNSGRIFLGHTSYIYLAASLLASGRACSLLRNFRSEASGSQISLCSCRLSAVTIGTADRLRTGDRAGGTNVVTTKAVTSWRAREVNRTVAKCNAVAKQLSLRILANGRAYKRHRPIAGGHLPTGYWQNVGKRKKSHWKT